MSPADILREARASIKDRQTSPYELMNLAERFLPEHRESVNEAMSAVLEVTSTWHPFKNAYLPPDQCRELFDRAIELAEAKND